ncbi:hypothetical protein B0H16DRAFT_1753427 [Mycena metata]|uniref:Uncharacterized protein n=1 Tax=Mycena metata TaxID=1033252 RepID=A0AAD7KH35_9AGAR|nr:hypothetical protein B0H16DRAFT_1753427 [Mycena metata]
MRGLWLATLSLLQLGQYAAAVLVNTTVDDLNPGPQGNSIVYFPAGAWVSGAVGGCTGCNPLALSGIAYMNTFHGSLFNQKNRANQLTLPTATLTFFGTSVSVNCILSNALENPPGTSDMTFTIDGVQAGSFTHSPIGGPGFQPSTVFTSDPLLPGTHTLVINNGRSGGATSLAILDSVEYSYDDLSSTPSTSLVAAPAASATSSATVSPIGAAKSSNTAAIAGGVVGALAILLLVALVLLYIRQRKNAHRSNVPLVTTITGPIDRLRSLWTGEGSSRPPPDMAPVPFPSPAPHASFSPAPRPPPPTSMSLSPGAPPASRRASRISFNANLLVGRFRRPPPPAISTSPSAFVQPGTTTAGRHLSAPHSRALVPALISPALPSGNPLLRQTSAPPAVVSSIQAWQRRTQEETAQEPAPIIHPLDMSEVDLSSHYDESSISSPPPAPPPPPPAPVQPPQRRFTVMNN